MGYIHFFKRNHNKEFSPPSESIEQTFARLYHRLMVIKANETQQEFPHQTVIKEMEKDIKQLESVVIEMFEDRMNQGESLDIIQEKADKLREAQSLFTKKTDTTEPIQFSSASP